MPSTNTARPALRVESLEAREVPAALQVVFDYRYDSTGFFTDPTRRAALEQAGRDVSARLNTTVDLAAISPAGANSWTATTFNPSNPSQWVSVGNLGVAADQIVVFVGAEAGVGGGEAGLGGFGGYSASGSQDWLNLLRNRGRGGFASWGGSIAFSGVTNWYAGTGTPSPSQIDLYSVAVHELGHVLGFGVSNQWNGLASGSVFSGAHARAANGGTNAPLSVNEPGHWQQGITPNGQTVSMQPMIVAGTRVPFSELDYAALADIGWEVAGINSPPISPPPASPPPPPTVTSPPPATSPLTGRPRDPVLVGGSNGTFQSYTLTAGQLAPVGGPVAPFPGFPGSIRVTSGDVTGDGIKDVIAAAGPGGGPAVRVFDGATGQMVRDFFAFEQHFRGGVQVATADFDGDGREDVIVGADEGGGPRVRIFSAGDPSRQLTDFYGIDDAAFRGGVRTAAGDINKDGVPDLVVTAGPGGGPRTAVYDGRSLAPGLSPRRLIGDFFAYDLGVRNGAYVAVADVNGDGFADVIIGPGTGSMHVKVLNGSLLSRTNGETALANTLTQFIIPQDAGYNSGARVAAGDFDADGTFELIAGTGPNALGRVFLAANGAFQGTAPFGPGSQREGVFVG
jgi:hypothetical protein